MKKILWSTIALVFAGTIVFFSNSFAGWFGSDEEGAKEPTTQMEKPIVPPGANVPSGATEEAVPAEAITLSGTIDESNNFIAENGDSYTLSENDQSMELKALSGKKVEIRGTVMEENGEKTVEVIDYSILDY